MVNPGPIMTICGAAVKNNPRLLLTLVLFAPTYQVLVAGIPDISRILK